MKKRCVAMMLCITMLGTIPFSIAENEETVPEVAPVVEAASFPTEKPESPDVQETIKPEVTPEPAEEGSQAPAPDVEVSEAGAPQESESASSDAPDGSATDEPQEEDDLSGEDPEADADTSAAEESAADVPAADEETQVVDETQPEEEASDLFSSGYALLKSGTELFADASMKDLLGTLTGESLVYVYERREVDGADRDVMLVRFVSNGDVVTGYVRAGRVKEASDDDAHRLLKDADILRNGILLANVSFNAAGSDIPADEEPVEESSAADETDVSDEKPIESTLIDETETPSPVKRPAAPVTVPATVTDLTPTNPVDQEPEEEPVTLTDLDEEQSVLFEVSGVQTGSREVTLSWNAYADSYMIYDGQALLTTISDTSICVSDCVYGKHTFTVIPMFGEQPHTEAAAIAEVNVLQMPPAPKLKATQTTGKEGTLEFNWSIDSTSLTAGFVLYEKEITGALTLLRDGLGSKAKELTLSGFAFDQEHTFVIGARTKGMPDLLSYSAPFTIHVKPLWSSAPSTFSVDLKDKLDTAVSFSWKPKYVDPPHWAILLDDVMVTTAAGSARSFVLGNIQPGTHTFAIAPMDENGHLGGKSVVRSLTVSPLWLKETTIPSVSASMNTKSNLGVVLTIKTKKNGGAPYWNVYDLTSDSQDPVARVKGGKSVKLTVKLEQQSIGIHQYAVRAANSADQLGPMSEVKELKVVPLTCLNVTSLKASYAEKNTGRIKLSWKTPYGLADRYRVDVFQITDDNTEEIFSREIPAINPYSVPLILENGQYRFSVTPISDEPEGTVIGYTTSTTFKVSVAWKKAPSIKYTQLKTAVGAVNLTIKAGGSNKLAQLQFAIDDGEWLRLSKGLSYTSGDLKISCTSDKAVSVTGLKEDMPHVIRARFIAGNECSLIAEKELTLKKACLFGVKNLKAVQIQEHAVAVSWDPFNPDPDLQYEVQIKNGRTVLDTLTISESQLVLNDQPAGSLIFTVTPLLNDQRGDSKEVKCSVADVFWKVAPRINAYRQTDQNEITIWFNAAALADGYQLYNSKGIVSKGRTFVLDGTDSRVVITGVSGKQILQLRPYRMVDSKIVYGSKSSKVTITVGSMPELADPTHLTMTDNSQPGTLALSWSAPNAQAFRFYAKDVLSGEVCQLAEEQCTVVPGWTGVMTGLKAGIWSIGIQPIMIKPDGAVAEGHIVWFKDASVTLPGTERRENVKVQTVPTSNSITVVWDHPADSIAPQTVKVYLDGQAAATVNGSANSAVLSSISKGVHQVTVTSVSPDGIEGLHTLPISVTVYDPAELKKPYNLFVISDNDGLQYLTWQPGGKVSSFRIYAALSDGNQLVGETTECRLSLDQLMLGSYSVYVVPVSQVDETTAEGIPSDACQVQVKVHTDANGLCFSTTDYQTATIIRYTGKNAVLTIPSQIGSCTVTAIADRVFEGSKTLQRITIPASITKVGKRCFAECDLLSIMN